MFRGRFEHTIDAKGRVSLPVKFREIIFGRYGGSLIITNFDRCICAYPLKEWEIIEEKLSKLSILKEEVRSFQRFFISGATEVSIDKQGRILIPPTLREYAAIKKEVVFAGILKKIEIWSKERWEEEFIKSQQKFPKIAEALAQLGI